MSSEPATLCVCVCPLRLCCVISFLPNHPPEAHYAKKEPNLQKELTPSVLASVGSGQKNPLERKTRLKSALKNQFDVKDEDLWLLPSWKCLGVPNAEPGLGRQAHSWGLMQKRRMRIRTADGDVPWEINPQHGWRAPEILISPPKGEK